MRICVRASSWRLSDVSKQRLFIYNLDSNLPPGRGLLCEAAAPPAQQRGRKRVPPLKDNFNPKRHQPYTFLSISQMSNASVQTRDRRHVRTQTFVSDFCVRQCPWQHFQLMVKLLNICFGCLWQKSDFEKMSTTSYHGGDP